MMNARGWKVRLYDEQSNNIDTLHFGNDDNSSSDAYVAAEKLHRIGYWQGHKLGCVSVVYNGIGAVTVPPHHLTQPYRYGTLTVDQTSLGLEEYARHSKRNRAGNCIRVTSSRINRQAVS
jgi:hypothetical protein